MFLFTESDFQIYRALFCLWENGDVKFYAMYVKLQQKRGAFLARLIKPNFFAFLRKNARFLISKLSTAI
jgi:hypothetical protein